MSELAVNQTKIPGLYFIDLPLLDDNRGWFKENYQQAKLEALGLPHLEVVQNNISFNAEKGVTRGMHLEPWQKYVSVAAGSVFGAWIDLRKGDTFGVVETLTITPDKAVFVAEGISNGFQTLAPNTIYTYLVNAHWSPDAKYTLVNAFDPELGINWPIPQSEAIVSEKDAAHPPLSSVTPMEY